MYGDQLKYNLLVDLIIMLLLLMMQLEKLGFIALDINLMCLLLFKKWKDLVENEIEKNLKCLRYNNVGEYCSEKFDSYYSYHDIRKDKTILGTPQENGVSKDEHNDHGACKVYEIACKVFLTVLG